MSYDDKLAKRVRGALGSHPAVTEKKMFGGVAFLLDGRMFCGIAGNDLMVRVGPDRYEDALGRPHARPMDFTGRPMRGYVFVGPGGLKSDASLSAWVRLGEEFVSRLPPAEAPRRRRKVRAQARRR